jgi:hypothetical protein
MATVTQLNPPIPVTTPKGAGHAHILIDYGQEHHLYWVVAQDDTCEFWTWENPKVRIQRNETMDRLNTTPITGISISPQYTMPSYTNPYPGVKLGQYMTGKAE